MVIINVINALKKYNVKAGELKRLNVRLKVIDLKLDNWDKIKAAKMNAVAYNWGEDGQVKDAEVMTSSKNGNHSSIVEDSACSRETLQEERLIIELKIADINSFIIEIDSVLNLLGYEHKWILDKKYASGYFFTYSNNKQNKNFQALLRAYNKEIAIIEGCTLGRIIKDAEKAFEKLYIEIFK